MRGINNISKRSIWICDRDSMYLNMLHGYLKERIGLPLSISDFTDVRYMSEKPETEEVLLLMIAEELLDEIDVTEYEEILVLTEGDSDRLAENHAEAQNISGKIRRVSRYSKAADVLNEVLAILSETKQVRDLCLTRELPVHIIGFYSPLGRCLQTQVALAMGQLLAENHKVLFLNFDPFPEERLVELGHGETLADLIYYYGCEASSLSVKLSQMTGVLGGLRIVPPAPSYMQIADVTTEEWMGFIREICKASACDYLLLDLSEALPCLFDVLNVCERIYTICGGDRYDAAKMESYRNYLDVREQNRLTDKTVFFMLPLDMRVSPRYSELGTSQLGEFLIQADLLPEGACQTGQIPRKAFVSETENEESVAEPTDKIRNRGKRGSYKKKKKLFGNR